MVSEQLSIPSYFDDDDIDYLFDRVENVYERTHVAMLQIRKNLNLAEPAKLAMELPYGSFISGGFFRCLVNEVPVSGYDLFFNGPDSFRTMIKRIHLATEGMFLHGYESDKSPKEFATGDSKYMLFTHATKPPLKLFRVRWYSRPEELIDKVDMSILQFAIDNDLNAVYSNRAIDDARAKRICLWKVSMQASTGIRMKRLMNLGYITVNSGGYDSWNRDEFIRLGQQRIDDAALVAVRAGQPIPTLDTFDATFAL